MHAKSQKGRGSASSIIDAVTRHAATLAAGSDSAVAMSAAFRSALGAGNSKSHLAALADTHAQLSKRL